MELWGITDRGMVRRQNQDVFKTFYDKDKGVAVLVVCDGMGGANAGNVASMVAVEAFMRYMGRYIENIGKQSDIAMKMADAVLLANRTVYRKSLTNDMYDGMGTTLAGAISTDSGEVIVNIGDSRVYHITDSAITQITKDHSVVEDMIARGDLTRAEAQYHPNKNLITRALGTGGSEEPDVFFLKLAPDEYMLLCSDGLSNIVSDEEIMLGIQHGKSVKESCEKLLQIAISRGAPDNVTVVIYKK